MAYITKPKWDENQTQTQTQSQSPTSIKTPTLTSSGPATLGGTSTVTQSSGAPTNENKTSSGSFVNLQNYLDANKPQAAQLGTKVASNIDQRGVDATNAINTAKTSFNTQVQAGTPTVNQEVINKAVAAPTTFANSADNASFTNMLSGTYKGPAVTDATATWTPASEAVNKATQTGDLVKTAGGQTELLRQIAPTPYSRGGMSMNQMLLQNTDAARNAITNSAQAVQPLKDVWGNTLTEAGQTVTDATKTAADTRTNVINQIAGTGGALSKYQQEIEDRLAATRAEDLANIAIIESIINGTYTPQTGAVNDRGAVANRPAVNPTVPEQAKAGQPTTTRPLVNDSIRATLGRLGMTEDKLNELTRNNAQIRGYGMQDLKGIDADKFLSTTANDYLKSGDVATADDLARYRALNNLIGNQGKDLTLEYGEGTDSYNKAMTDLNRQISTYNTRKEQAVKAEAVAGRTITDNLKALGYSNGNGSSMSFQPGDEKSWVDPNGVTLADRLQGFIVENPKLANSMVNQALTALSPPLGFLSTVLGWLGINVADKLGSITGLTEFTPAEVGNGSTYTNNSFGGANFDTASWGVSSQVQQQVAAENARQEYLNSIGVSSGEGSYGGLDTGVNSGFNSANWGMGSGSSGGYDGSSYTSSSGYGNSNSGPGSYSDRSTDSDTDSESSSW